MDQAHMLMAAEVGVFDPVQEVPNERYGDPDQEHPDRDGPEVLDDPQTAEDREDGRDGGNPGL